MTIEAYPSQEDVAEYPDQAGAQHGDDLNGSHSGEDVAKEFLTAKTTSGDISMIYKIYHEHIARKYTGWHRRRLRRASFRLGFRCSSGDDGDGKGGRSASAATQRSGTFTCRDMEASRPISIEEAVNYDKARNVRVFWFAVEQQALNMLLVTIAR